MQSESIDAAWPWQQLMMVSRALDAGKISMGDLAPIEDRTRWVSDHKGDTVEPNPVLLDILCVLTAFESEMHLAFHPKCQIYVLGLASISRMLNWAGGTQSDISVIKPALSVLHSIGLVYRLPCALKFGYSPAMFEQIRISGWGRAAIASCDANLRVVELAARGPIANAAIEHDTTYKVLISMCSSDNRPLDIRDIHTLNLRVPIPIVT